jgi:hypothetical protein
VSASRLHSGSDPPEALTMSANNLILRLMTRAVRTKKTAPIHKVRGPIGRRIEELEDRTTPASG